MKHHGTGGPDWRINLQSDKSYLVPDRLCPKVTVLAEYNKILCFNQPIKSHIGKLCLAAINILFTELSWIFCLHWSLYIILHSNLKTYIFFFFCCSFSYGVGLVKLWFVSPPDRLSCKVWETFLNSEIRVPIQRVCQGFIYFL